MRGVEEFVRATQTQEPRAPRGALLRPAAPPVRALSGSVAAHRPQVQTPFESYVAVGEGGPGQGEVTPLPVGDVTLLDHSSGSPIDISQTSSVVLRMNSRIHIFPFTVSARNVGGDRVWKCDVFIEPGAVPLNFSLNRRSGNLGNVGGDGVAPVSTLSDGTQVFLTNSRLASDMVTDISVFTGDPSLGTGTYATRGVHYNVFPIGSSAFESAHPGLNRSALPQIFYREIHILPAWADAFRNPNGTVARPRYELFEVNLTGERAYAQIAPGHGVMRMDRSAPIASSDVSTVTVDNNGNTPLSPYEAQTVQFEMIRAGNNGRRRRSWHAQLAYFEKTDEWLCTGFFQDPSI